MTYNIRKKVPKKIYTKKKYENKHSKDLMNLFEHPNIVTKVKECNGSSMFGEQKELLS